MMRDEAKSINGDPSRYVLHAAERAGPTVLRAVLATNPEQFSSEFARLALIHPDLKDSLPHIDQAEPFIAGLQAAANSMSPDERARAIAEFDSLPMGTRGAIGEALAMSWVCTDPEKAAAWALSIAEPESNESPANAACRQVFGAWLRKDSKAALASWNAMPASPLREALSNDVCTTLALQGHTEEALALYRPLEGSTSEFLTETLAVAMADRDPSSAAAWLDSLPPALVKTQTIARLTQKWSPQDMEGAARWAESLPDPHKRDTALSHLVRSASARSEPEAARWIEKISDPRRRNEMAGWLFQKMDAHDPASARQWMRGFAGVDPEWRERFLRLTP
jgi:hypothetical protein